MGISEADLKLCNIFADETCTTQHRYMVIGCVIAEASDLPSLATEMHETKRGVGMPHEIKWERISRKNFQRYIKIVDCLFDHIDRGDAHFHSIVIDTSKLNHRRFNGGDREVGFSKFVFQLLLKMSRIYGPAVKFRVSLDERETKQPLRPVQDMLNFKANSDFKMSHFPYRRVQFHNSKKSVALQAADILTGAVGFDTNGKGGPESQSPPKWAVAQHIAKRAGLKNLRDQTAISGRFTIWRFRLS